ncbi:hypothetical protein O6P43_006375 [Quillaja saponaria]|uniref:Uncharacterized protein n=1 Tax=Quillaja saponaria TaxID=32244 RepID=A0AAD7Q831_QUISA|nr:hypothetical protein O6P43_006375 [Quillaja saponaria]
MLEFPSGNNIPDELFLLLKGNVGRYPFSDYDFGCIECINSGSAAGIATIAAAASDTSVTGLFDFDSWLGRKGMLSLIGTHIKHITLFFTFQDLLILARIHVLTHYAIVKLDLSENFGSMEMLRA